MDRPIQSPDLARRAIPISSVHPKHHHLANQFPPVRKAWPLLLALAALATGPALADGSLEELARPTEGRSMRNPATHAVGRIPPRRAG